MSVLVWLIKLPFKPVVRWLTALLIVVLGLGWWTGYLDLGARYVFWRYWSYSTPLIAQAPADAKSLLLVDMTRPGISGLAPLVKTERVKKLMQNLATTLGIEPQRDLLQILSFVDVKGHRYVIYRGRFMPKTTQQALNAQAWKTRPQGRHVLYTKGESKTAWLWMEQSLMFYGPEQGLAELAKNGSFKTSIISDAQFMSDLQVAGNRHVVTGLIRALSKERPGRLVFTLDSPPEAAQSPDAQVQLATHVFAADAAHNAALQKDLQAALGPIKAATALLAGDEVKALIQASEISSDAQSVIVKSHCSAEQLAAIIGKSQKPSSLLNVTTGLGLKSIIGGLGEMLR